MPRNDPSLVPVRRSMRCPKPPPTAKATRAAAALTAPGPAQIGVKRKAPDIDRDGASGSAGDAAAATPPPPIKRQRLAPPLSRATRARDENDDGGGGHEGRDGAIAAAPILSVKRPRRASAAPAPKPKLQATKPQTNEPLTKELPQRKANDHAAAPAPAVTTKRLEINIKEDGTNVLTTAALIEDSAKSTEASDPIQAPKSVSRTSPDVAAAVSCWSDVGAASMTVAAPPRDRVGYTAPVKTPPRPDSKISLSQDQAPALMSVAKAPLATAVPMGLAPPPRRIAQGVKTRGLNDDGDDEDEDQAAAGAFKEPETSRASLQRYWFGVDEVESPGSEDNVDNRFELERFAMSPKAEDFGGVFKTETLDKGYETGDSDEGCWNVSFASSDSKRCSDTKGAFKGYESEYFIKGIASKVFDKDYETGDSVSGPETSETNDSDDKYASGGGWATRSTAPAGAVGESQTPCASLHRRWPLVPSLATVDVFKVADTIEPEIPIMVINKTEESSQSSSGVGRATRSAAPVGAVGESQTPCASLRHRWLLVPLIVSMAILLAVPTFRAIDPFLATPARLNCTLNETLDSFLVFDPIEKSCQKNALTEDALEAVHEHLKALTVAHICGKDKPNDNDNREEPVPVSAVVVLPDPSSENNTKPRTVLFKYSELKFANLVDWEDIRGWLHEGVENELIDSIVLETRRSFKSWFSYEDSTWIGLTPHQVAQLALPPQCITDNDDDWLVAQSRSPLTLRGRCIAGFYDWLVALGRDVLACLLVLIGRLLAVLSGWLLALVCSTGVFLGRPVAHLAGWLLAPLWSLLGYFGDRVMALVWDWRFWCCMGIYVYAVTNLVMCWTFSLIMHLLSFWLRMIRCAIRLVNTACVYGFCLIRWVILLTRNVFLR